MSRFPRKNIWGSIHSREEISCWCWCGKMSNKTNGYGTAFIGVGVSFSFFFYLQQHTYLHWAFGSIGVGYY
jgi:hypothetical protein